MFTSLRVENSNFMYLFVIGSLDSFFIFPFTYPLTYVAFALSMLIFGFSTFISQFSIVLYVPFMSLNLKIQTI